MISLRLRLFMLVVTATALVWSAAATWTVLGARSDIEEVLDRRLREAAHMVASLNYSGSDPAVPAVAPPMVDPSYERQLSCQIWSLGGNLVRRSGSAPATPLSAGQPGFSERTINGVRWRVYTYLDPASGLQVMVGDTLAVRQQLVTDLIAGLLVPAAVGLVALAALLWLGVNRGLAPVRQVAAAITARGPSDLQPLGETGIPAELTPLTQAIDGLFARVTELRARERQFLASAAHEMQTPLAGLKTHADIALRSSDPETRTHSLARISLSVDRTARLVRQLLDLARQEGEAQQEGRQHTPLRTVFAMVEHELESLLAERNVTLRLTPPASQLILPISEEALLMALRNLVENAVIYGPGDADVIVGAVQSADSVGFYVEDQGPGLTADEAQACTQPFVRGQRAKGRGSGLGLAIAHAALANAGMTMSFEQLQPTGFRITAVLRLS